MKTAIDTSFTHDPDRAAAGIAIAANRATGPGAKPPASIPGGLPGPGDIIGKYEVIRELGRGGMGAVFLARDTKLGRRVAIKFLLSQNPELNARFIMEARATARFQHENIVVIHEVDEHEGNPFMVLEFLQGSPLSKLLEGGRSLTPRRAVDIIIAVARALERAHANNIVHRDLKPDNVYLTDDGRVKVLDFGIAKLLGGHEPAVLGQPRKEMASPMSHLEQDTSFPTGGSQLTRQGAIVGTIPYMAPEQWGTVGDIDQRTDIWACGIMLFRMIAGKHPLAPLRGRQLVITAILDRPMPRSQEISDRIPVEVAAVIDRCLIKYKEQRMESARALLDALEGMNDSSRSTHTFRPDETPYAGLSSFQETDAKKFFGRQREIAAVATRLQKQSLMAIVGPSGVGKSSFVRAGLMPALKRSGEQWSSVVLRPGRDPMSALAQIVAPMLSQHSHADASAELAELDRVHHRLSFEPGYAGVVLRSQARRKRQRMLVFVDQFEELYTLVEDPDVRLTFTRCLSGIADDPTAPLRVVISIRSDFLDRVPEDEQFMAEVAQGLFFLRSPGRNGLRDALIEPAEMVGYTFEAEAIVDHMLDHLQHTPGALPLLQFAATKLWELRDCERRLFTEDSYRQLGGIAGALASHADSVLAELPQRMQTLARTVFMRLVTPDRTRAIVSESELHELTSRPSEVRRLLEHLVQARLLVIQASDGSGAASVEIVHESLIHSWPLLRKWLDENQDDAVFLSDLRTAAKQWDAKHRPNYLLWRDEAAAEAERWFRRSRAELPALEHAYLQAVLALARRSIRRKRLLSSAIIAILVALVAAAAVALVIISRAQKQASEDAERARVAEVQAREALDESRKNADAANQQRERAEEQQAVAERERQEARKQSEVAEIERQKAERARAATLLALAKAKRSKRHAKRQEEKALKAAEEARQAKEQAELLAKAAEQRESEERQRRIELEEMRSTHIPAPLPRRERVDEERNH